MPFNIQKIGDFGKVDEPELVAQRAKVRAELKYKYVKAYTDPHRCASGQGGFPFEAAFQRYFSMKATQRPYFKPNLYTFAVFNFIFIIPCFLQGLYVQHLRSNKERRIRSGQISYKERSPKYLF